MDDLRTDVNLSDKNVCRELSNRETRDSISNGFEHSLKQVASSDTDDEGYRVSKRGEKSLLLGKQAAAVPEDGTQQTEFCNYNYGTLTVDDAKYNGCQRSSKSR